ncbi:TVP38/TMEM64 family protein [Kamptonema formosum]|uniref:TVP38/TMEM64 family protein n=1 Tax=Kamptonema formosum TaxID=331992 RepID=UPI0003747502|nr:TVP38/TMEM64 family protein [Oscillatoria sp. PCC 10802]
MENPVKNGLSAQIKLIAGIVLVVELAVAAQYFNLQGLLKSALSWTESLGAAGFAAFILIYILATVLFLPGSVLTLGAGALFGVVWGSVCVSIASTLGATAAFLVGRYLARGWVEKQIVGNEKFKAIDAAVAREGWKIVGLTRLSPIFPFNLLNYAFGVTQVSLRDYFFASWIGMMPGTVMYVYLGSLGKDLATLGTQQQPSTLQWLLRIVGLIATVLVTVYVTRLAKTALDNKIDS